MSQKWRRHYNDPRGTLLEIPNYGITIAANTTVPADASAGYAPGCLFFDINASIGAQVYINEGSKTSSDFNALTPAAGALSALTATVAELNTLHTQTFTTGAGAGYTDGVGAIYKNSVQLSGGIYVTRILLDLTGTASSTTDLDIIGSGVSPAYIGQITVAQHGTILAGRMQCLEVPAGGVADIDLYWATEATGKFDDGIAALTETALITAGGAWTLALTKAIADPVGIANGYLYLTCGAAGTPATYTAGKFLIELFGY